MATAEGTGCKRQYLFFDLGWTIEDESAAQRDRAARAAEAMRRRGVEVTPERVLALQDEGAARLVPAVFTYALERLGLSAGQARSVAKEAGWNKELLCLYPDARPTLERLRERHFVGLIANQSGGTRARLERYGITPLLDLILASDELGVEKPDRRIFEMAQARAGCAARECWMIGDRTDNDIAPAKALGWRTVRVLHGYSALRKPEGPEEMADYTVPGLPTLLDILT